MWDFHCIQKILKGSTHKDLISLQKNGFGETNILQQILWKAMKLFRRYGLLYILQWLSMEATILYALSCDQIEKC